MREGKPHYRHTKGGPQYVGDSLQNVVSGLGGARDKRSANQFTFGGGQVDFLQLEAAYVENWLARMIVNIPVDDALREWRTWNNEDSQAIEHEEDRLDVVNTYREGRYWARLYGGAVLLMVTDQPLDKPLDVNRLGKGSLRRLVALDRWDIQPQVVNWWNPVEANYLMPEWYHIRGGENAWIHESHLVRLEGETLPRRMRQLNETWGGSTLWKVLEDIKDTVATKNGIATMIQEANVDVVSRQGLSDELASGEESKLIQRYALAGQMKSLVNQLLLDGDSETFERKQITFSGLAEVMDKFMVWASGAAEIPMTRFFGRSAAGMSATGEGDLNNYYDKIGADQESKYKPELKRLDEVLVRSALGEYPDDVDWEWNPLYQEDGTELAQQNLADAQAEDIRINNGTLRASEVMTRIRAEKRYQIDEEVIKHAQENEEAERNGEFDGDPDDPGLVAPQPDEPSDPDAPGTTPGSE